MLPRGRWYSRRGTATFRCVRRMHDRPGAQCVVFIDLEQNRFLAIGVGAFAEQRERPPGIAEQASAMLVHCFPSLGARFHRSFHSRYCPLSIGRRRRYVWAQWRSRRRERAATTSSALRVRAALLTSNDLNQTEMAGIDALREGSGAAKEKAEGVKEKGEDVREEGEGVYDSLKEKVGKK